MNINQRIDQMARQLAVASLFSEHPQADDDYERIIHTHYPFGVVKLEGFVICEDEQFHHANRLVKRLRCEYDKLKDFAQAVLSVKQVWRLDFDWDGGTVCDVVIGNQCHAQESFIETINSILSEGQISSSDLGLLNSAVGEYQHPFWETHQPFIYRASMNEVTTE